MATDVEIPAMGESVKEAILVRWLKANGERVATDEPICELETDKANVELPAQVAGVLHRVKEEGETVHVGETIARIEESDGGEPAKPAAGPPRPERAAPPPGPKPAAAAAPPLPAVPEPAAAEPAMSPSVRRLIAERGLDATAIASSGPGGRVTREDVLAHAAEHSTPATVSPPHAAPGNRPPPAAAPRAETAATTGAERPGTTLAFDADGVCRVPMSKIRRRIAERLVRAQHEAAMLTTFNEIDMSAVNDLRARYKTRFSEVHGVSLGLMSFFVRACTLALREFPVLNAYGDGDDIVYHQHVHLSVAVSTERGLVVPVLSHAEILSFARIEAEIRRMAAAARDGKLSPQELGGGTFTITNGGVFGSLLSTPILNPPQSAILGMHLIQDRPVAVNGRVEIRPMMYAALSYDHRVVDGKDSVRFLVRVKELIEEPARLTLEI